MHRRIWALLFSTTLLFLAYSQVPAPNEQFRQRSLAAERSGLAEPFLGVTTNGTVQPGLFPLRSTKVSTEPARQGAAAFLASLTPAQRAKTLFPVDDLEWRKWMNQDFYVRQGVSIMEMSAAQKEAAYGMMRGSLSAKGLKLSQDIMKLNETLGELNDNNFVRYGEGQYWLTVMGEPSKDKPWGWQLDGHHLIINYFVLGDQVVMTPTFLGSEPVIATSGKYKGTSILQDEQARGLRVINSLTAEQKHKAILESTKTKNYNLSEAFKDNLVLDYAGLKGSALTAAQKKELLGLIEAYVSNTDAGHAKVKMDEVKKHLDSTWFAWIGGTEEKSVYYYRVHSPVILIEFDHQVPVGLRHLSKAPTLPDHEHIHTVIRTPNGNDYGKDLLRQHYAKHPH
jgi:hypothetical protein